MIFDRSLSFPRSYRGTSVQLTLDPYLVRLCCNRKRLFFHHALPQDSDLRQSIQHVNSKLPSILLVILLHPHRDTPRHLIHPNSRHSLEPLVIQQLPRRRPLRRVVHEAPREQRTRRPHVPVAHLRVDVREAPEPPLERVRVAQAFDLI